MSISIRDRPYDLIRRRLGRASDIDFAGVHESHFNLVSVVDRLLPWRPVVMI
jgi:hypothetical protein